VRDGGRKGKGSVSTLPTYEVAPMVAEWLACCTQAQKGLGSNRSCDTVR